MKSFSNLEREYFSNSLASAIFNKKLFKLLLVMIAFILTINISVFAAVNYINAFNSNQSIGSNNNIFIDNTNNNVGIGTTTPASTLTITGNFSATGTKSAVVNTSYGIRKLYAMESSDIRFYDQ